MPTSGRSALLTLPSFRVTTAMPQVLPCSIRHVHDWSSCNFTHPGEKARRRDPQTHSYTGIACPDMKKVRRKERPLALKRLSKQLLEVNMQILALREPGVLLRAAQARRHVAEKGGQGQTA